jgi:hypothetical protein
MFMTRLVAGVGVSLALFACAPAQMPSRGQTDVLPAIAVPNAPTPVEARRSAALNIVGATISAPRTLLVSEADVYLPNADIVWHGDPLGDRHTQVEAMFSAALAAGTTDMTQGYPVTVQIEVKTFHALTPKTRATLGGNFAMQFYLTVLDGSTGQILDGPRLVIADTPASGGRKALREEAQGITQKVVIEARLAEVLREELQGVTVPSAPVGPMSRDVFSPMDLTLAQ